MPKIKAIQGFLPTTLVEYEILGEIISQTYQLNFMGKFVNLILRTLIRLGIGPKHTYLLTVRGRTTGKPYSTPATLLEENGARWLVAPYGEVSWVRNARAAGSVTLARQGLTETVAFNQVSAKESAPVLKKYLALEPFTQPYFDARSDSPVEAFESEASRHPVFRLRANGSPLIKGG